MYHTNFINAFCYSNSYEYTVIYNKIGDFMKYFHDFPLNTHFICFIKILYIICNFHSL